MRILVVDDEIDTLGLIELTLQTAGYDVKTVPSGEEALKQLRAGGYDAVLLDEMMPDRTGSDVLRTLREENVAVPPVIFLTAKSRPEDRAAGASLGAADYLVKPTTRGQLLDAIRKLQETSSTT